MYAHLFVYTGPQHDPQKLIRASLASSCLRGALRVFQFQDGERGRVLRRKPVETRPRLIRSGVFHHFAQDPALCGDGDVRPLSRADFASLCDAVREDASMEMAEWFLARPPHENRALHDGLVFVPQKKQAFLDGPLVTLVEAVCSQNWAWAMQRVQEIVQASEDPVVVRARDSGRMAMSLLLACAKSGSETSLLWAEHFAAQAPPRVFNSALGRVCVVASSRCTLPVMEWLAQHASSWKAPQDKTMTSALLQAVRTGRHDTINWLAVQAAACNHTKAVLNAAASGRSALVMQMLFDLGFTACTPNAGTDACRRGSTSVLEWLWQHKRHALQPYQISEAAASGDLKKVLFLRDCCGFPWTASAAAAAAVRGHMHILEWAAWNGLDLPDRFVSATGMHKDPVVQLLAKHVPHLQCTTSHMAMACATSLATVEALHQRFPHLLDHPKNLIAALCAGELQVVQYLRQHAPKTWGNLSAYNHAISRACGANNVELLQFLQQHGAPASSLRQPAAINVAARRGALQVVEWLHEHQGVSLDGVMDQAVSGGMLRVVQYVARRCDNRNVMVHENSLIWAVRDNHIHVLEYLVREGLARVTPPLVDTATRYRFSVHHFLTRALDQSPRR